MKKKVNGKVIDVDNIELFEKAFEGVALGRLAASSVQETVSRDSDIINSYISAYESVYKSLPFPLYAIEGDVKYSMIANVINHKLQTTLDMWINKALFIGLGNGKAIKFLSGTWGLVSVDPKEAKPSISISEYSDDIGYKEFSWVLERLLADKSLSDFYIKFMPKFVEACHREPMILKWELGRMLDFGFVPVQKEIPMNRIINPDNMTEYIIDVFSSGKQKTGGTEYVIDFTGQNRATRKRARYITVYDFECYEKKQLDAEEAEENRAISRMKRVNLGGFGGVFETIISKASNSNPSNVQYSGVILGNRIVYQIENQIFICDLANYRHPVEIGKGVSIYSYDSRFIYISKKSMCESNICKESIYAFDPMEMQIRLCKIQFN